MPHWIFSSSELGAAIKMNLEPPAWKTGVLGRMVLLGPVCEPVDFADWPRV